MRFVDSQSRPRESKVQLSNGVKGERSGSKFRPKGAAMVEVVDMVPVWILTVGKFSLCWV